MEELITTVIILSFNFALDVRNTFSHQTGTPAYYEVKKSDNVAEARSSFHYLVHSRGKRDLADKRVFHRWTVVDSHKRLGTAGESQIAG